MPVLVVVDDIFLNRRFELLVAMVDTHAHSKSLALRVQRSSPSHCCPDSSLCATYSERFAPPSAALCTTSSDTPIPDPSEMYADRDSPLSHESLPRVRSESPRQMVSSDMEADNLAVKQIHIWIEIQLVYDGLTIILPPVFEFTRIRCDLLVRDRGFESAAEEIVCSLADSSPIGAVLARSVRKGMHLQSKLLHNPLHRLAIDLVPKIS